MKEENLGLLKQTVAIIPAKADSIRLPNKNLLEINGKPLFLSSVDYAVKEGIPVNNIVVSTDSDEIIDICEKINLPYYKETVNDTCMTNCVNQVLSFHSSTDNKTFVILQPTSPLRKPGMLVDMLLSLEGAPEAKSIYSCNNIKFIGHLGDEFHLQRRDQDEKTKFFHFHDGNILIVNTEKYKKDRTLFDNSSLYYKNEFPYTLQIDSMPEYWAIKRLLEDSVHVDTHLPLKGRKKLVVVSNKGDLERDYSKFVDSCDKVIRVNRMDSMDTGLVGSKTTDVLVAAYWYYESFNPAARKVDVLKRDDVQVWFIPEPNSTGPEYALKENIKNWNYLSFRNYIQVGDFTTFGMAIGLAVNSYPDYDIYVLGDLDPVGRAPGSTKHPYSKEREFIRTCIEKRLIRPILELERDYNIKFSEDIDPKKRPNTVDQRLVNGTHSEYEGFIKIVQPDGLEFIRVLNNRVFSERRYSLGTIISNVNNTIALKMDNSPTTEEYILTFKDEEPLYYPKNSENITIQQV